MFADCLLMKCCCMFSNQCSSKYSNKWLSLLQSVNDKEHENSKNRLKSVVVNKARKTTYYLESGNDLLQGQSMFRNELCY